jgi:hypothetical protein
MLFLSTLAAISEEELKEVRTALLPHRVMIESNDLSANTVDDSGLFSTYTILEDVLRQPDIIDIPDSMEDNEGNISMFLAHPSSDQVMTSHDDLDASHMLTTQSSENGDVEIAIFNPLSPVTPPDIGVTARTQLSNDNISTGPSQPCESDNDEQIGRSLVADRQTKRSCPMTYSLTSAGSSSVTKRARTAIDTTSTQSDTMAMNSQRRSGPPSHDENSQTINPINMQSHFIRSFETLTSKYGDDTNHNLNPAQIINVIQAGDIFVRENCVDFVNSYIMICHDRLWNTPVPCSPLNGTIEENLFKRFNCAEILNQRSIFDPIRLRVARILLFCYYEQLLEESRNNPELLSRRSRGRDHASIATDVLLEELCGDEKTQPDTPERKKIRTAVQKHKQIGKRWSIFIGCIGPGLLLLCNPDLAAHM